MRNKHSILGLFLISWLFLLQCTQPQPAQDAQMYVKPTLRPTQQAIVATAETYLLENNIEAEFDELLDFYQPPHRLWFEQTYKGIPMLDKRIVVVVNPNKPTTHTGAYSPDTLIDLPNLTPTISQEEAMANAMQAFGFEEATTTHMNTYLALHRVPRRGKTPKYILVWFVTIYSKCPFGDWAILVDAQSGAAFSYHPLTFPPKGGYGPCPTPIPLPTLTPAPMSPFETPAPPTPNPYFQTLGIFEPGTVAEVITHTTPLCLIHLLPETFFRVLKLIGLP